MTKPFIVAVSGKRGAGKTALADILVNDYGFVRASFALPLKEKVRQDFDLSHEQVYGFQKEIVDSRYGLSSREILIKVGQIYRAVDPNYWVKQLEKTLLTFDKPVVIDDMRFRNEIDMLRGLGAYVVRLDRLLMDNIYKTELNDPSETDLDHHKGFSLHVAGEDNRTISDLYAVAERITNVFYQSSVGSYESSGFCAGDYSGTGGDDFVRPNQ